MIDTHFSGVFPFSINFGVFRDEKMKRKRNILKSPNSDMSSGPGLKPPSKLRPPARGPENEPCPFAVGDRVLAAGKRGKIAFLGETEFASGEWAGIILDDPVGKYSCGPINVSRI